MHKAPAPSRDADKFVIRLPDGLREKIRVAALDNMRSMNSEIIARLSDDATARAVTTSAWSPMIGMAVQLKVNNQYDVITGFEVNNETLFVKLQEHSVVPVAISELKPVVLQII